MNIPRELAEMIGYHKVSIDDFNNKSYHELMRIHKYIKVISASKRKLQYAVSIGRVEMVRIQMKLMTELPRIVFAPTDYRLPYVKMFEFLLAEVRSGRIESPFKNRSKGFCIACYLNETEILKLILNEVKSGSGIFCKDNLLGYGCKGFISLCANGNSELVKILSEILSADMMSTRNSRAFRMACFNGHVDVVRILVEVLPRKALIVSDNLTFINSCLNNEIEVVRILIKYLSAEDLRACDNRGFRYACRHGHAEIVKMLIPLLDIEDLRACKNQERYFAQKYGHDEIVKILTEIEV